MPSRHAYKEVRLQQLRSFCETARLGSLAAAAEALGLAQPTVWEQVHALEREFGTQLVEPHGRGCRLTEAGRRLTELAAPLVAGIDALPRSFAAATAQTETWLAIAGTQRIFVEDLTEPIAAFARSHPHVRFRFLELRGEQITSAVEAREADLGLTTQREPTPPHPWLVFEPVYELDPILVTPPHHPLARRRHITPADLAGYPLVNAPQGGFADAVVAATLEKLGLFREPRRVEAVYTAVIRRYVEMGFGIGVVPGLPGRSPSPTLHERSLGRWFGRIAVNLIWRKGALQPGLVRAFADTIKLLLNKPPPSRKK
jgi:molybdate transport repressor ModE-like protein